MSALSGTKGLIRKPTLIQVPVCILDFRLCCTNVAQQSMLFVNILEMDIYYIL